MSRNKKSSFHWLWPLLFLLLCGIVIWFLHLFIVENGYTEYIIWDSSVQLNDDGTETNISVDTISNTTDLTGSFRFSGELPANLPAGTLMFETTNLDLTLLLNDTEIFHSTTTPAGADTDMVQAHIPLSEGTSGTLTMTCKILDGSKVMFPPLIRFMSNSYLEMQVTAQTNLSSLPAGAAALAFLMIIGLFLLGIPLGQKNFSLLPLALSTAGLGIYHMAFTEGYYFLPPTVNAILGHDYIQIAIVILFFIYLAMNRRRDFLKRFAIVTAWSIAALLIACLISYFRSRTLLDYIMEVVFGPLVFYGLSDTLLYWLTYWLTLVCGGISSYEIAFSFIRQRTETQAAAIRNELLLENYHTLQTKMKEQAALRHEFRHHLTALDSLYQKADYQGMKELLDQLKGQAEKTIYVDFSENETVNIILQDIAQRALKHNIDFRPFIQIPPKLRIPDKDLCSFVMNMLDNALEACESVEQKGSKPFIRFHMKMVHGFLAIRCENSYQTALKTDESGELLTTKEDPDLHGFGLHQMKSISEKYQSILNISQTDDCVFTVQTALKIPD
ncbi:MAG: GHKL domain-containing protein [Lachnospiraceae bacterium]|nr:GHKL domain-containing protein [Lachnospiraceae bacterium]